VGIGGGFTLGVVLQLTNSVQTLGRLTRQADRLQVLHHRLRMMELSLGLVQGWAQVLELLLHWKDVRV
jgi:hypothetical protein